MVKLFVGGFPLDMQEMELVQLISPYGEVDTIKIIRDKRTRICKGYAFVEMKDVEGTDRAIEALNGAGMGDRILSLNIVDQVANEGKPKGPYKPAMNDKLKFSTAREFEVKKRRPRL
jgi:RNA recognition motif-containing protein